MGPHNRVHPVSKVTVNVLEHHEGLQYYVIPGTWQLKNAGVDREMESMTLIVDRTLGFQGCISYIAMIMQILITLNCN